MWNQGTEFPADGDWMFASPARMQQRLMRHADIRTTMNVYGDIVTNEMEQASGKVAVLALTDRAK